MQFNQKASVHFCRTGQCNLKIHTEEKRLKNNGDNTEEKERMGRKESLFLPDIKRWNRMESPRNKKYVWTSHMKMAYKIRKGWII